MHEKVIPILFDQSQWPELRAAADSWRLPYWDWAARKPDWHDPNGKYGPNVPYIVTQPKVEVRSRTGTVIADNPMWKYSLFQKPNASVTFGDLGIPYNLEGEPVSCAVLRLWVHTDPPQFDASKATVRQPRVDNRNDPNYVADWVQGNEQNYDPITANLRGHPWQWANTLPEAVYRLMLQNYLPTYNSFASTWAGEGPLSAYASLEGIHNNIHVWVGGSGHMTHVPVAAFDPIFWLHHK